MIGERGDWGISTHSVDYLLMRLFVYLFICLFGIFKDGFGNYQKDRVNKLI